MWGFQVGRGTGGGQGSGPRTSSALSLGSWGMGLGNCSSQMLGWQTGGPQQTHRVACSTLLPSPLPVGSGGCCSWVLPVAPRAC